MLEFIYGCSLRMNCFGITQPQRAKYIPRSEPHEINESLDAMETTEIWIKQRVPFRSLHPC